MFELMPFIEIRQTVPCRAIRGPPLNSGADKWVMTGQMTHTVTGPLKIPMRERKREREREIPRAANFRTKILDFGGFDSSRVFKYKRWNSDVHREFPGNVSSRNLSSDNLSREIGRKRQLAAKQQNN